MFSPGCSLGKLGYASGVCQSARDESQLARYEGRRRPVLDAELLEDVDEVCLDGRLGDAKDGRDLLVALAARDAAQHAELALGERQTAQVAATAPSTVP